MDPHGEFVQSKNLLTFRIDADVDGVTRDTVKAFVEANATEWLIAYEISDVTQKPHFQGWIRSKTGEQSMKGKIKEQWPDVCSHMRGRTKGKYSCVMVKKAVWFRYCLKGTPTELPDIVTKRVPEAYAREIENEHRKWWSEQASTPPKQVHIVQEGISVWSSIAWGPHDDIYSKRMEVTEWILNHQKGKGQNQYTIKAWLNGILNEVDSEHREVFKKQVAYADKF